MNVILSRKKCVTAVPEDIIEKLNTLPVEEVAERLGVHVIKHKAHCFMHEDKHPSLSFNLKKNIFFCFVCNKGGGPIKLVQDVKGCSFQKACEWLAVQFGLLWSENDGREKPARRSIQKVCLTKRQEENVFDEELLAWLIENAKLSETSKNFLFEERFYKKEVIQGLNIKSVTYPKKVLSVLLSRFGEDRCLKSGLARKGGNGLFFYFFTPCLLFPYYEQDGRLVGIQSRYLGGNSKAPRFQFLSSQNTRVFNLPILNALKRGDTLYISEGITDCLALLSSKKNAVAIPSATILPLEDLVRLKDYDLHMYPDQDEAGQRAFMELRRFFVNHYSTIKAEKIPSGTKDFSEYYIKARIFKVDEE